MTQILRECFASIIETLNDAAADDEHHDASQPKKQRRKWSSATRQTRKPESSNDRGSGFHGLSLDPNEPRRYSPPMKANEPNLTFLKRLLVKVEKLLDKSTGVRYTSVP